MENESQVNRQAAIEKDIQGHLNRISSLLVEQEAMDTADAPQFDLAVKYQLTRIQELLEDGRGRQGGTELPVSEHLNLQEERKAADLVLGIERESGTSRSEQIALLNKLFSKVRHNRYKEVETILDTGISPDVRDQFGNTLIILACQNGNKRIAKICLRRCCDMDAQNLRGQTALHYCYAFGYRELGDYILSKGARDDITNEFGMTCYDGLEPSEVRLQATPPGGGQIVNRQQLHANLRAHCPPLDDDTESLTSTTSGFSTDTTTDTYPSCASPRVSAFDADSPIRRSRSLNLSNSWFRASGDAASRSIDMSQRRPTPSIDEFAEEQALQLEALANALRALKSRGPRRCDEEDTDSGAGAEEGRGWPRRASSLEVPESPVAAVAHRADPPCCAAASPAPPVMTEESSSGRSDRWAVPVAAPRRLKPAPPPVPPPPTAKRIFAPGSGAGSPAAHSADWSGAAASIRGEAATGGAANACGHGGGVGAGEEEDDEALSARLTWRTATAATEGHAV